MERTAEEIVTELLADLRSELAQEEDAERAIEVYKMANWIISQLDELKESALKLAEQDMQQRNLTSLKIMAGSAGWTVPKAKQLNERAWKEALVSDSRLMDIQRQFDLAQAVLDKAQEPFTGLPESRFFIR
jgi:hypothetical protein